MSRFFHLPGFRLTRPGRIARRAALGVLVMSAVAIVVAAGTSRQRTARTTAGLNSAAAQLQALTGGGLADDQHRAAIAWGYSERLRLGLESPFRLIEAAARDPRLALAERRTVSWALLAHVLRGETHQIDAAALDLLGPWDHGRSASGEQHLLLIADAVAAANDPRAGELAVRVAYTLASAERLVDGAAPLLAAEAAAMIADREVARREAGDVVRSSGRADPIEGVRRRRERRSFYVERPVLLAPDQDVEHAAIAMAAPILDSLRAMRALMPPPRAVVGPRDTLSAQDATAVTFATRLFDAGARVPPVAPLAVTVHRYLPLLRSHIPRLGEALSRVHSAEMLVAALRDHDASRSQRRSIGRLLLAAAVSMRSLAQEPIWFEGDSSATTMELTSTLGLSSIAFDRDVPLAWRPYFLRSFADGVRDLRRVLPTVRLDGMNVRFRMNAPADSALAMHDPRTRTLHLPIPTAGGTLVHELAHDLDRQSARGQGLSGYRSDHVARARAEQTAGTRGLIARVATSIQALTEELSEVPGGARTRPDRPAEIFATRVDWFVASALAREGITSGFLSAVQDELLTGHVVHPERLRSSGSSRSLVAALEGMTTVAPLAAVEQEPSVHTLLRWALAGPVDRRVAADLVRGGAPAWATSRLIGDGPCEVASGRVALVRMAAEARARGWLRQRARWAAASDRAGWARSVLRQGPWSEAASEQRVAQLRDYVLVQLGSSVELPAGLAAYAAPLAIAARCAD